MAAVRDKVTFDLGGESYEVSPDFGVIDRIESGKGRPSLLEIAERMESSPRVSDMAFIVHAATAEAGYRIGYREIGQACLNDMHGAGEAVSVIMSALFDTGEAGERQQGKPKAATAKPKAKGRK